MCERSKDDYDRNVSYINGLSDEDFCSLFYTNGIFALISPDNIIPSLDMRKKIHLIKSSKSRGFDYIPKTLAERCDECLFYLYPDIVPDTFDDYNHVPETNDYMLWNDDYDCHTVYVSKDIVRHIQNSIEDGVSDYQSTLTKIMGRMKCSELSGSYMEYGPNGDMVDIRDILIGRCKKLHLEKSEDKEEIDLEHVANEDVSTYDLLRLYGLCD